MSQGVKNFLSRCIFTGLFVAGAGTLDCVAPPANNTVETNMNVPPSPQPAASPSPTPLPDKRTADMQFTLPLLDALLSDDQFLAEARKMVSLTDEEVQRLKDASRKAGADLSEDDSGPSRSAKTATEQARAKLQDILGSDRGEKLIAFAQNRPGDTESTGISKPNSVPTDTRVVVNAPAYRMDVFKDGKLLKTYKIGIGYPEFPLPSGMRKASTIIFNPTWTPPDEAWVKGKVKAGKKVGAGDKLNPLGPIKIPIGLPSLIHGGKSPSRLGTFASHGCVGLTDPQVQDFAMVLSSLSGEPLTIVDIKGYEKAKTETKEVKLRQPVPVELRYETIVVEDGTLKIFRDVYEKGTNTEENLRAALSSYGVDLDSLESQMKAKILTALRQMATDAGGEAVASSNTNKSNSNSNSGSVTRNIKGKKEVDLKLPELAGKGYPAPVGLKM